MFDTYFGACWDVGEAAFRLDGLCQGILNVQPCASQLYFSHEGFLCEGFVIQIQGSFRASVRLGTL